MLEWNECSLPGDATLQLRLNFRARALFERIGATARNQYAAGRNENRRRLHLLILGSERCIAIEE
jgi:hypothetical protein